jgi:3-deoxy-manno-octulosonate cytidylyltransferase (CMP-KDO synthetase)
MTKDTLIIIPARLAATRLPRKPMAMIGDEPMIVHVWKRAMEGQDRPGTRCM